MESKKSQLASQLKARKSFDYQCKKASKCRQDKFMISCYKCPELKICTIQKAIDKAQENLHI